MRGMGDIIGDDFAFFKKLGPEVTMKVSVMCTVSGNCRLTTEMKNTPEDRKNSRLIPSCRQKAIVYAIRTIGFEKC